MTVSAERPPLGDVNVGDRVVVLRSHINRRYRKPDDYYYWGTVTKAARVWITVEPDGALSWRSVRFRRDDQTDGSKYSSESFMTPEQFEWRQRVDDASTFLREQGIDTGFGNRSGWNRPDRRVLLADAVRDLIEREGLN